MNLILGSANFCIHYGINKKKIYDLKGIFNFCLKKKIRTIDTAFSYNGSHNKIIRSKMKNINIITKIDLKEKNYKKIYQSILSFKKNLKKNKLYSILIHDIRQFHKYQQKDQLISCLKSLVDENKIKKLGVSTYNLKEFRSILKFFKPKIVQIPLNVFDDRFLTSKWFLTYVKKNKVEIHARSCFLQGLLLKKKIPTKFKKFNSELNNFFNWCDNKGITYLEGCINFVKKFNLVNSIVVGAENLAQFKEIYSVFSKKKKLMCQVLIKIYYVN